MYQLLLAFLLVVCGSHTTAGTNIPVLNPTVTCLPDRMIVCFMKDDNFKINPITVQQSSCYDITNNTNSVCVITFLQYGQCGRYASQNSTHVTYSISLYISQDFGGPIMRNDTLTVNANCLYPLNMLTSLGIALHPEVPNHVINVYGLGSFNVSMALYRNSNYTSPYNTPGPAGISLSTKEMLYVAVFVNGGDTRTFVMVMKNCFSTPTPDYNNPLKYYIIQNSCPNTADLTISVPENGVSRVGRFQVQMYKYVGNYDSVYLHCQVSLCNTTAGSCQPSCGARSGDRSSADEPTQTLSVGPFSRSSNSAGGLRASWAPLVAALALMMSTTFLKHL